LNEHIKHKIPIHLKILAKSKPLEDYCTECGKCCKGKIQLKDKVSVLLDKLPCKYLKKDNRCSVYSERFDKAPWCLDTAGMIEQGAATSDCPYVQDLKGYIAPKELSDKDMKKIKPLVDVTIRNSRHDFCNPSDLKDFLSE